MSNHNHVTIVQQGQSPRVVIAGDTLRETLDREGIDTEGFAVMRGGAPADLDAAVTTDMTVTVTKKSTGA